MTRDQIELLRCGAIKPTRGHVFALCEALIAALDACDRESSTDDDKGYSGTSFRLGWKTAQRVVCAGILEVPMP